MFTAADVFGGGSASPAPVLFAPMGPNYQVWWAREVSQAFATYKFRCFSSIFKGWGGIQNGIFSTNRVIIQNLYEGVLVSIEDVI